MDYCWHQGVIILKNRDWFWLQASY